MKFSSEIERLEHPAAGLIPKTLWVELFEEKLSNIDIEHQTPNTNNPTH